MQARQDASTALLNKATFERSIDDALRQGKPFALLLIDIDRLKAINDQHGHLTGDAVIKQVAAALRASCRATDIAGRIGGDEFAVLLPEAIADEAARLAERVGQSVRRYRTPANEWISLDLSIGWACYPLHGRARDALVDAADRIMYATKRERRNAGTTHRTDT